MFTKETIDFASMTEEQIKDTLAEYRISLTIDEILKIQNEILKRPPSVTECLLWSIQGSEHSSYKSSRNHLKQFVTSGPNVILGPSEDAGIVEIARDNEGNKYGLVVSHESHNHPSQIVPYEGAATGIGGNVRDVCCMGAKVIACADPLRFGEISSNKTKWIHEGVVSGIAGYGNPIGVPNLGGDLYYDKSYNDNCLVNVVTLGILREDEIIHSYAPKNAQGYDLILVGKPTDNSGFGGASFASFEMKEEDKETNKGAVQEPNAFLKRHLLKANNTLFEILKEKNLLDKVGFKDLGAGGISCAGVELADAADYGVEIDLDKVHKSMEGLHPSVILCAETQERFMWVCHPDVTNLIVDHYNKTFDLPNISAGAKASVVGKIREDDLFVVRANGEEIVRARAKDVTQGLLYDRPYKDPGKQFVEPDLPEPKYDANLQIHTNLQNYKSTNNDIRNFEDSQLSVDSHHIFTYNETLLKILSHENVASRLPVYEQYDKQVQGIAVIEPGEADAGVTQPFKDEKYPDEIRNIGVALSVDQVPRYGKISPYWSAVNAVCESVRNVAAVGATPQAMTDCLCFGNPEKPEQMWEFVEGTRGVAEACKGIHLKEHPEHPLPIISGNVSLYNESKGEPIAPSAIISCSGKINDVNKAITMHFKKPNSTLFMIGARKDECGGSVYYDLFNELGANVPKPDLNEAERQYFAITDAIDAGLLLSAHDISDGGVAVTLSEMSFRNEIGCDVSIPGNLRDDKKLFGETGGFIVETCRGTSVVETFKKHNIEIFEIGKTTANKKLRINDVIDLDLLKAKNNWTNGLREKL